MILSPAHIEHEDAQPRSIEYRDIYFAHDGAAETARVFIEPMQLDKLFGREIEGGVRVGELGFGSGLNFLAVCEAFLKAAPDSGRLDYIAFEKHPLRRADIENILQRHASDMTLMHELVHAWPHRLTGWHTRYFAGGRIRLLVYQGDALDGITDLQAKCHAWLLDGFDPRVNPEIWSEPLLAQVAEKSEANARIASFTAQGMVRRRLASLGFTIERVDQRPHKRHSLAGRYTSGTRSQIIRPREVAVIGAGFAGTFTAHLLAIRGIAVHLFDPHFEPMPIALAHARLGDPNLPLMQLRALARGYSNDWYRRLGATRGVLEAPTEVRAVEKIQRNAEHWLPADDSMQLLDNEEAREKSGLSGVRRSLWHGQCHVVEPRHLRSLMRHHLITRHEASVASCHANGANWTLTFDARASQTFAKVVVCAGAGSLDLLPKIDAQTIGGQMERAQAIPKLKCALVGEGFAAPGSSKDLFIGATFEREPMHAEDAERENIARATRWLKALGHPVSISRKDSWRGRRVYHKDLMPIVGELASGLHVNCAFGASGSLLAPLAAELVASQIAYNPLPITRTLMTGSIASI